MTSSDFLSCTTHTGAGAGFFTRERTNTVPPSADSAAEFPVFGEMAGASTPAAKGVSLTQQMPFP